MARVDAHAAAAHGAVGVGDAGDLGFGVEDFRAPVDAFETECIEPFAEVAGEGAEGGEVVVGDCPVNYGFGHAEVVEFLIQTNAGFR